MKGVPYNLQEDKCLAYQDDVLRERTTLLCHTVSFNVKMQAFVSGMSLINGRILKIYLAHFFDKIFLLKNFLETNEIIFKYV